MTASIASPTEVLRIAKKAAQSYARRCWWASVDDLTQEAAAAILKAQTTFDPNRGTPFRAYALRAAEYALQPYLWGESSPVSGSFGAKLSGALAGLHRAGEVDPQTPAEAPDPATVVTTEQWARAVQALVRSVDPTGLAREVLLNENKSADVAADKNIPVNHVYSATAKAREALKRSAEAYQLYKESIS